MDLLLCELEVLQGRFGNLSSIYNIFNRELKYSAAKWDSTLGFYCPLIIWATEQMRAIHE